MRKGGGVVCGKSTELKEKEIISVVDDFDCSAQGEKYDAAFKKWRRNKNNPFTFNFEKNSRESVYVESKGFDSITQESAETEIISRIMNIIGIAMLMFIVFDNVLKKLIICALDLMGVNVHTSFAGDMMFGGSREIVSTYLAITAITFIVPSLYLHFKLRLPVRVEFMSSMNDSGEMIASIALTLAACSAACLPSAYSGDTMEIFTYFSNINTDVSVWGQHEFIVYTIFDVIVISILTECMLRGAIFNALRQFGDIFAAVVTAIMAALMAFDVREIPAELMISVIAGIGMLRSGSISTAFVVRAVYKMYRLALIIIESGSGSRIHTPKLEFILMAFLLGAAVYCAFLRRRSRRGKKELAVYSSKISDVRRLAVALTAFPFSAVAGLCVLITIIRMIL